MNKNLKVFLGIILTLFILAGCFSGGILVGWLLPDRDQASTETAIVDESICPTPDENADPADSQCIVDPNIEESLEQMPFVSPSDVDKFAPLQETIDLLNELYIDRPLDEELLIQGALNGMMESLGDAHSSYLNPFELQQLSIHQDGSYEGIGAWVDTSGEYVVIISPMKDSPAEEVGLKAGDQVIAIDGEDMTGIDGSLVLQRILGPAGTSVTLTIQREGEETPLDFVIERAEITVPSVEGKMLEEDIAYILLSNYGQDTAKDFRDTLQDLLKNDPKGLILDLRGNGGGYLQTAVDLTSEFLQEGQFVLHEEYGDGERQSWAVKPGGIAQDIPLIVLVDFTSASASEITAGAIQDYERGLLVGTTTYGKGSVQNIVPLSDDQGAVRITVARWLTPKDRQIHEIGLEPDVVIEFDTDVYETDGTDNQLEKAIELLLEGSAGN